MLSDILFQRNAFIFRIVHRDNVPFLFEHGIHCRNSNMPDPQFVRIGNPDIIDTRHSRVVEAGPRGTLGDYVPFYFTPCTPMLYNIVTGRGVPQRQRSEIIVLMTSLDQLERHNIRYVIADRNAALKTANISTGRAALEGLPWEALRNRNLKHDRDDPEMFERYQAEALVHERLPAFVLRGIITHDVATQQSIAKTARSVALTLPVRARPHWYP